MTHKTAPHSAAAATVAAATPGAGGRSDCIDSRRLFSPGSSTVTITHGDTRYTLRLTRDNKLILTK